MATTPKSKKLRYVTTHDVDQMLGPIGHFFGKYFTPLEERVAELERCPLDWKGVWVTPFWGVGKFNLLMLQGTLPSS